MIFYHFTARAAVDSIRRIGIVMGEAPLSERRVARAVNLTTDPNPQGHGLDHGGHIVDEAEAAWFAANGFHVPAGTVYADKLEARISVKLPSTDRWLKRWRTWALKHCDKGFPQVLEAAAGPAHKSKSWWLYFDVVPPEAIIAVTILKP